MGPIIICIECRERTTLEQIRAGYHSHADFLEMEAPFDPAANADEADDRRPPRAPATSRNSMPRG